MTIAGTMEIDSIVYSNETIDTETIKFEEEKWHKETIPVLTKFYFDNIAFGYSILPFQKSEIPKRD